MKRWLLFALVLSTTLLACAVHAQTPPPDPSNPSSADHPRTMERPGTGNEAKKSPASPSVPASKKKKQKQQDTGGAGDGSGGWSDPGFDGGSGTGAGHQPGATPGAGATDPLPDDDEDLKWISRAADGIHSQALDCTSPKKRCPKCNCAAAASMFQNLVNAEANIDAMHGWLITAATAYRDHFNKLNDERRLTDVQLGQALDSLALQEYLHNLGNSISKVASLIDTSKKILEGDFKFDPSNMEDTIDKLDSLAGAIKNESDLANTVIKAMDGSPIPEPPQVAKDLWDAKSAMKDGAKALADVAQALKEGKSPDITKLRGGALKVVNKALLKLSEKEIRATKQAIEELKKQSSASDLAIARAYKEMQRAVSRQNVAQDSLAAIRQAKGKLTSCMNLTECKATTVSRPRPPSYTSWGEALRGFNALLPGIYQSLLGTLDVRDECSPTETFTTPNPPPQDGPVGPPIPPKYKIAACPACQDIADDIGRKMVEIDNKKAEIESLKRNLAQAGLLAERRAVLEKGLHDIDELIRKLQAADFRPGGVSFTPKVEQDLVGYQSQRESMRLQISSLDAQIGRLQAEKGKLSDLNAELTVLNSNLDTLQRELRKCRHDKCDHNTMQKEIKDTLFNIGIDKALGRHKKDDRDEEERRREEEKQNAIHDDPWH